MNKENEIIQRIDSCYVGDDCIQTSVPYKNSMTILNSKEILYHSLNNSPLYINKYIDDDRRHQFPYSNIPAYKAREGLFKYNYVNQISNFEEPYIRIFDGNLIETFAIKDKNEAYLIKKILPTFKRIEYMTREELERKFEKPFELNKNLYIMSLDGSLYQNFSLMSEDEIMDIVRNNLTRQLKKYIDSPYHYFDSFALKFFQDSINNMTAEKLPERIPFRDEFLLISTDETDIFIQIINVSFIKRDYYQVNIVDIPVYKYTLEQLKFLSNKIFKTKEPHISTRMNPGISKKDINSAKQFIKKYK